MSILPKLKRMEVNPYNDEGFRNLLEDHMSLLRNSAKYESIPPTLQHRYHGNLYGLLATIKSIELEDYWLVMRLNDFVSPSDYSEGMSRIKIPDSGVVYELYSKYTIRRRRT